MTIQELYDWAKENNELSTEAIVMRSDPEFENEYNDMIPQIKTYEELKSYDGGIIYSCLCNRIKKEKRYITFDVSDTEE